MARGNYIYPPGPTMRLTTDLFEYCHENVPKWNTISISGYHIREKGCSAVQEVAFTLSNAIAYVEAALERGLKIDEFAPRLAFFFNCHNNVFQEVAKFRAVRRMWAKIVEERFGAKNPNSMKIRFHTQTGGVTLQAQQPEVNIIRVALQGFAAVAGGTQSPAHQRLRRGAGAADRALGADRPAHPAGARPRVRRRRHRRPLRRLLLRRVADRRDRSARLGADGEGRGAGRLGRGAGVHAARDRGVGALLPRALPERPGHHRRRQQIRHRPGRRRRHPQGRPRVRAASAGPPQGLQGERATRPPSRPSWRRSATSPAATATCCTRSAPRSPPTPRSARSAARCATSSANTTAAPSSRPLKRSLPRPAGGAGTGAPWWKPAPMIEASRTLMKSEPELAELVEPVEGVEVTMAEKGFGTRVAISAPRRQLGLSEADLRRSSTTWPNRSGGPSPSGLKAAGRSEQLESVESQSEAAPHGRQPSSPASPSSSPSAAPPTRPAIGHGLRSRRRTSPTAR